jgi:predicted acyltransferase
VLAAEVARLRDHLAGIRDRYLMYPTLHYFVAATPGLSLVRMVFVAQEIGLLLDTAVDRGRAPVVAGLGTRAGLRAAAVAVQRGMVEALLPPGPRRRALGGAAPRSEDPAHESWRARFRAACDTLDLHGVPVDRSGEENYCRERGGWEPELRAAAGGAGRVLGRAHGRRSLDAFRGATIAAMLLVNNPGTWSHIYAPLRHAEWHGWTPTDLIFPFFLFIVGVAIVFSFGKQLERGRRALMMWVPVPGHGAGVLEPGRDLGSYVDRAVFGTAHLWRQAETWDPEGLLSTIPVVGTVLLGVLAGGWLRSARPVARTAAGLAAAGAAAAVVGWVWGLWFPINKNLWTGSYALFTAGLGALSLAACFWVVDIRGHRRWAHPFHLFGVNAIAAFFLSSLMARILVLIRWTDQAGATVTLKGWIYGTLFEPLASPRNASLLFALAYVGVWLVVMAWMDRRKIHLKV